MGTRPLLLVAGALLLATFSTNGQAGDIARWVDENGVTHFGNPQFAPGAPEDVMLVKVQPANRMVVPTAVPESHRAAGRITVVKKKAKSNPRGWRGYRKSLRAASRPNRRRR